jgi:GNAT superfamily N-acetyltransferase
MGLEDFIQNRYGYCFYEIQESIALIYNLYVHPEHRNQGKAGILLLHVINEIRHLGYNGELGIEAIPKENTISVEKLCSFYKKMGLKILAKTDQPC